MDKLRIYLYNITFKSEDEYNEIILLLVVIIYTYDNFKYFHVCQNYNFLILINRIEIYSLELEI